MHFPPSLQKGKTYQFQSQSFKKLLHVHVGANVHHVHYARTYGVVWGSSNDRKNDFAALVDNGRFGCQSSILSLTKKKMAVRHDPAGRSR